jgi:cysteine desulfurase
VLKSVGMSDEDAWNTVRFSFGLWNTLDDIDYIMNVLPDVVSRLRELNGYNKQKSHKL